MTTGLVALLAGVWGVGVGGSSGAAWGQLRIVQYNIGSAVVRPGVSTIAAAIGAESRAGIAKRPDVFAIEESDGFATDGQALADLLNTTFGVSTYRTVQFDVGTSGAGRPGIVYDSAALSPVASIGLGTLSSSGNARQTLRTQFRLAGYTTAVSDFYLYVSHYKASNTTTDANRRGVEAATNRANADALGEGAHVIMAGDFNLYTSTEPAWTNLTATGNGQLFDPVNRVGNWNNNSSFRDVHTQAPNAGSPAYGGQVTGGLDDRFDFQVVSGEFLDGQGLAYIPGTYRAFGNNGTHALNGSITSGTGASAAVLEALRTSSDHLPVVADYQIPARMTVDAAVSLSGTVIRRDAVGAVASVGVTNSANVVAANGADRLSVTVSGTGGVVGQTTATATALAGAVTVSRPLDTATAGNRTGTLTVTPTSQGTPEGPVSRSVSYTVVDGSNASFDGVADVDVQSLDLGIWRVGSGVQSRVVPVFNLPAASGFTAGLAVTGATRREGGIGLTLSGATGVASLAAGESTNLVVSAATDAAGSQVASYQVLVGDSAGVFGGTSQTPLVINARAKVVSFAAFGSASVAGTGLAATVAGGPLPGGSGGASGIPAPSGYRLGGEWSPAFFPRLDFGPEGLVAGEVFVEGSALFPTRPEFDVLLGGGEAVIARVRSDWELDGSIYGYSVSDILGGLRIVYGFESPAAGGTWRFNLSGTGATVLSLTSVPEPGVAGVLVMAVAVTGLRRRREA